MKNEVSTQKSSTNLALVFGCEDSSTRRLEADQVEGDSSMIPSLNAHQQFYFSSFLSMMTLMSTFEASHQDPWHHFNWISSTLKLFSNEARGFDLISCKIFFTSNLSFFAADVWVFLNNSCYILTTTSWIFSTEAGVQKGRYFSRHFQNYYSSGATLLKRLTHSLYFNVSPLIQCYLFFKSRMVRKFIKNLKNKTMDQIFD